MIHFIMADVSRRCHDANADQFEAEIGDPLYESVEGALIRELAMKRGGVGPTLISQSSNSARQRHPPGRRK